MSIAEYLLTLPRPTPSAGMDFYEAELKACLHQDSRKQENYLEYKKKSRRVAEVTYLPVKLDIENVSRCNFACSMCVVSSWPKRQRAHDMTLKSFEKLIDDQYGLVEIKLNGLGEPLLQGDDFFEMIKYARARRIWVRITTNGSLLHLKSNFKKLVDSDVCEIDISVDGHSKEVFEAIRIGSHFETVKKNIKMLNDYGDSVGKKRTKMWTLVQKDNFDFLESHLNLARELNFKNVVFSLNLHGWGDADLLERNRLVTVDDLMTVERMESLVKLSNSLDINLAFWNVNAKFDSTTTDTLCPWPFERAVITSDSKVVPCCMVADPSAFHFEEKTENQEASEIWLGDEYASFRQDHIDGKIPRICRGCYKSGAP